MGFDLTGKMLISTPAMGDPRFERSVVFLCAYGPDGAFGLVLNRPLRQLSMAEVLEQIGIEPGGSLSGAEKVLAGGPVESQRGFVLHDGGGDLDPSGTEIPGGLTLSASTDVLKAIRAGTGPAHWLLALGYAGWGPGQLEQEIAQNAWLTGSAPHDLVFNANPGEHQWSAALRSMGIDPLSLSSVAGRA